MDRKEIANAIEDMANDARVDLVKDSLSFQRKFQKFIDGKVEEVQGFQKAKVEAERDRDVARQEEATFKQRTAATQEHLTQLRAEIAELQTIRDELVPLRQERDELKQEVVDLKRDLAAIVARHVG
jgi:chromosome segregation ATPase